MANLGNTPRPAYVYDTETDTWVPIGVGAHTHDYIPNTLVDAKGDILTATADNVPARLAKGADGTVLVSDSTTSTGLAWQPYGAPFVAGKNKIINGDFGIWQRATSIASATAGAYTTVDRFKFWPTGGTTDAVSRQSFTPGATGITGYEPQYFIRNVIVAGGAGSTGTMVQHVEDVRTLANQTFTFSFWAKADSTKLIAAEIQQQFGTGGSSAVTTPLGLKTIGTTWQRYSFTGILPSVLGKTIGTDSYLEVTIWMEADTGSYSVRSSNIGHQSGTFDFWGVQLEAGSIATPFTTHTGSIEGELAACQRYYTRFSADATYSYLGGWGPAWNGSQVDVLFHLPVQMRTYVSSIDTSGLGCTDNVSASYTGGTFTLSATGYSKHTIGVRYTHTSAVFTTYRMYTIYPINNSSGYIGFSAEL